MTFCVRLKEKRLKDIPTGKQLTVVAEERTEKTGWRHYAIIVIGEDGYALDTTKTARTTWRRKYKEIISDLILCGWTEM